MALLLLFLGLFGQWLLGFAAATTLLRVGCRPCTDRLPESSVEQIGLGIVLGIGLTSWSLFVWSLCGGMLGIISSLMICGIGFAVGFPVLLRMVRPWLQQKNPTSKYTAEQRQQGSLIRICQCWIGLWILLALVQSLITPQRLWDERAIFAIKGAVLFEDHSIHSHDLAERDFVQGHPRYPLLLPLAEQNVYALVGEVNDRLSKILFPLLFAGLVLTMVGVLLKYTSTPQAWMFGSMLATVPALMPHDYGFLCGQADAPVACYHGVAIFYLWDVLEQIRILGRIGRQMIGPAIIAGICGGLAAFTKDEGNAFLIVDGTVLVFFSVVWMFLNRTKQTGFKRFVNPLVIVTLLFVTCAVAVLLPWSIHRRHLPSDSEMNYIGRISILLLIERLSTLSWTVPHLIFRMFGEWREWGLHWWGMLMMLALFPRKACRFSQFLLLADVLGALAALVVAGMLAPVQLEEHIGGSSHRFLMQIAPVAVLFMAGQFIPPNDTGHLMESGTRQDSQP